MSRCFKKRRDLNDDERQHLFMLLVKDFNGKKLQQGSIKKHAELYSLSCKTVSRLWNLGSKFIDNGEVVDIAKKLSKHVGRKKIQIDVEIVKQIPLRHRKSMAALAHALEISKATVHRRVKEGLFRRHSNSIKPQLTNENKKARLQFCISMLQIQFNDLLMMPILSENEPLELGETQCSSSEREVDTISSHGDYSSGCNNNGYSQAITLTGLNGRFEMKFLEMFDHVVIDEKWFYMSKEIEKYYLVPDEVDPYRSCKSKKFITKVMFLAAVARPRFDERGNVLFDGKIGIFPFTYQEPAKRRSKNRVAGTLETKPILAITQEVSRSWMVDKLLPAIRDKWPISGRNSTIFIQQDNARPKHDCIPQDKKIENLNGKEVDKKKNVAAGES